MNITEYIESQKQITDRILALIGESNDLLRDLRRKDEQLYQLWCRNLVEDGKDGLAVTYQNI